MNLRSSAVGAFVSESERGGVETADRVILADAAAGPWRAHVSLGLDQREAIAIGTGEMETLLAESLVRLEAFHAERGKALCPELQRVFRHGENGLADFAGSSEARAQYSGRGNAPTSSP